MAKKTKVAAPMLFEVEAKAQYKADAPQKGVVVSVVKLDTSGLGLRGGAGFGDYIANKRNNKL